MFMYFYFGSATNYSNQNVFTYVRNASLVETTGNIMSRKLSSMCFQLSENTPLFVGKTQRNCRCSL